MLVDCRDGGGPMGHGGGPMGHYSAGPPAAPLAREAGTVSRWFDKGYGFILPAIGGEEIFVHNTDIEDGEVLEVRALSLLYGLR